MRRLYARLPIRGLSLVVFAVLLGGSLTASWFARRVMADQEHRMLEQRAGEAAALFTNQINQSQASTRALAAVVLATGGNAEIFIRAAGHDPALASGTVALVREDDGRYRVVAAAGTGLMAGQELRGLAADAIRRSRGTDKSVSTVFAKGGERLLGRALRPTGERPGTPVRRASRCGPPRSA